MVAENRLLHFFVVDRGLATVQTKVCYATPLSSFSSFAPRQSVQVNLRHRD